MPRWRQTVDENGKSVFVPLDEAAAKRDGHFIVGDIETFRSPIDGEIISDRKQYREHCAKHGVVPAQEFDSNHYERKAKERYNNQNGIYSREETFKRKQEIYNAITAVENGHRPHIERG